MPSKKEHVVAVVGDRRFSVPPTLVQSYVEERYDFTATIRIIDGRPHYSEIHITNMDALTPLEVQRLPWGRFAEGAIEDKARDASGGRAPRDVQHARRRAARGQRERVDQDDRQRKRVDHERLREVVALHDRASERGERRWDVWAAGQLGYSPAYTRKLYGRAISEGLTTKETR